MALKFGEKIRTPAMQAGLVAKRLSFREVFTAFVLFFFIAVASRYYRLDFKQSRQDFWREWAKPNDISLEKRPYFGGAPDTIPGHNLGKCYE